MPKSLLHVQSHCFANCAFCFVTFSSPSPRRVCLSSLLFVVSALFVALYSSTVVVASAGFVRSLGDNSRCING